MTAITMNYYLIFLHDNLHQRRHIKYDDFTLANLWWLWLEVKYILYAKEMLIKGSSISFHGYFWLELAQAFFADNFLHEKFAQNLDFKFNKSRKNVGFIKLTGRMTSSD